MGIMKTKMKKVNKEQESQQKKLKVQKRRKKMPKKDTDLQSKNLDDFLQDWSDEEENDDVSDASEEEEQSENSDKSESGDEETSASDQKKYLASLKEKDPEFHKFLEENDQELLNFDESSDEEENDKLDPVHKLPDNLEVASDDSDYDDDQKEDESKAARPKVTKKMIDNWSQKLENNPSVQMVSEVVMAFKAALTNIAGEDEEEKEDKK